MYYQQLFDEFYLNFLGTRVASSIATTTNHHRIYRKNLIRLAPGKRHPGKLITRTSPIQPNPICDNSNDSGLEVDGIANTERYYHQQGHQHRFLLQNSQTTNNVFR